MDEDVGKKHRQDMVQFLLCCLVLKDEMTKNLATLKNLTASLETKVRPFVLFLWENSLEKAQ